MKDKKNIDRLFREKFRDFEANPDEVVWKNIQAELAKEKDKKVPILPLWSKIAGVAALLALLFLAGNFWFIPKPSSAVVDAPTKEKTEQPESRKITKSDKNSVVDADTEKPSSEKEKTDSNKNRSDKQSIAAKDKATSLKKKSEKEEQNKDYRQEIAKTQTDKQADQEKKKEEEFVEEALAKKENKQEKQPAEQDPSKNVAKETDENEVANQIAKTDREDMEDREVGRSIFDELAKKEADRLSETKKQSRISIRPNIAPIYYSSIGGGSAMDPQFADNRAQGEVTMAYGIDLAYAISKQVKLRTGISKINMSYNTPDIAFAGNQPHAIVLQALESDPRLDDGVVMNNITASSMHQTKRGEALMTSAYTEGKLNQELAYIEVPLEVEYALVDKKFGISLIGGASTLILSDDGINLDAAGQTTDLGRAANVRSTSFTTNIGIGLGYNFSKKLNLSIEPTFKYQLSGFKGQTGNFRPYYIGVYSGVSFKF